VRILRYTGRGHTRATRILEGGGTESVWLRPRDRGCLTIHPDSTATRAVRLGAFVTLSAEEEDAAVALVYPAEAVTPEGDDWDTMSRSDLWGHVQDLAGDDLPFGYVGTKAGEMRDWLRSVEA